MVEQISNKNTENSYTNVDSSLDDSIEYRIQFYDFVLLLIPLFFTVGISTTFLTNISLEFTMAISAILSAIVVGYCLFADYVKELKNNF